MINSNAVAINKEKITETYSLSVNSLLNEKYILIQKEKELFSNNCNLIFTFYTSQSLKRNEILFLFLLNS